VTIYFSDSQKAHYLGEQYPANVTKAEIAFCAKTPDTKRT
jgi:hypothetical protein